MRDIYPSGSSSGLGGKLRVCANGAAFAIVVIAAVINSSATVSSQTVDLKPCTVAGVEGRVLCGTHEVFENRARRAGRKISLKIVVFAATGANPQPDPFVYIPGGPGSSATRMRLTSPSLLRAFANNATCYLSISVAPGNPILSIVNSLMRLTRKAS